MAFFLNRPFFGKPFGRKKSNAAVFKKCVYTERLETTDNAAVMTNLYDSEFTPRRRMEKEKEKWVVTKVAAC